MSAEDCKWLLLLMQMVLFGVVWMIENHLYKEEGHIDLLGRKNIEGRALLWKSRLRSGLLAISFIAFWIVYGAIA